MRKNFAVSAAALFGTEDAVSISAAYEDDPRQSASAAVINADLNYRTTGHSLKSSIPWFLTAMGGCLDAQRTNVTCSKQYWAFEEDHYFHVVVESSSGQFRHFGAGQLSKFGDWTGGTYVYGQRIAGTSTSQVGLQLVDTSLLDGIAMDGINPTTNDMELYVATLHCEGLPGQVASGKYAVHMGNQASGNLGNDRQSTPIARSHFVGGHRGGPWARVLSRFEGSDLSGHLPMYPIGSMYWRRGNSDAYGPMGVMKDVRGVSIRDYVGGQELTIGGDTWVIFPVRTKWSGSGAHTSTTDYQGIAYKKIP